MEQTDAALRGLLVAAPNGLEHEFNNLLGVILNYTALAERQVSDPGLLEDLGQIRAAAERAANLTVHLRRVVPEAREPATRALWRAGTDPAGGDERILVVEDEETLRTVLARMLTGGGYHVEVAPDADGAESLLAAGLAIDLLVSDVVMPGRSGPELVDDLERRGLTDRRRVLLISGTSLDERDVGELPLLRKPFTQAALLRSVRGVLDVSR